MTNLYWEEGLSYKDQLRDHRWIALRKQRLEFDHYRCRVCGDTLGLVVHHLKYFARSWEVPLGLLLTLCQPCHLVAHKLVGASSGLSREIAEYLLHRMGNYQCYARILAMLAHDNGMQIIWNAEQLPSSLKHVQLFNGYTGNVWSHGIGRQLETARVHCPASLPDRRCG